MMKRLKHTQKRMMREKISYESERMNKCCREAWFLFLQALLSSKPGSVTLLKTKNKGSLYYTNMHITDKRATYLVDCSNIEVMLNLICQHL